MTSSNQTKTKKEVWKLELNEMHSLKWNSEHCCTRGDLAETGEARGRQIPTGNWKEKVYFGKAGYDYFIIIP